MPRPRSTARARLAPLLAALAALVALVAVLPATPAAAAVPAVSAEPRDSVQDLTCVSATRCLGVGGDWTPKAWWWDAAGWHAQPLPLPAGATGGHLSRADCPTTRTCLAVGWVQTSDGRTRSLALRWTSGTWTSVPPRNPSDAVYLGDVTCASATSCTAVGQYVPAGATWEQRRALVQTWDGSTWTRVAVPAPTGSSLGAVDCRSATSCVALGRLEGSGAAAPFVLVRSGAAWTRSSGLAYDTERYYGVSCSTSACSAFGGDGGSPAAPVLSRWDGTTWSTSSSPALGEAAELSDVSCVSGGACVAVGSAGTWDASHLLVERSGSSGTWRRQAVADPSSTRNDLFSVSCSSGSSCVALGTYADDGDGLLHYLVERWDGSAWAQV